MTCFFSVVVVVCFDILDRNVVVYIIIHHWTREVPILTQLSPAGSRFSHQIYSMQNGQRPRQKERKKKTKKKKSAIQDRRVLNNHICAFRLSRIKQPTFFFFLIFRSTTDNFVWIGFQLMNVWRGASVQWHAQAQIDNIPSYFIQRSNHPTTNFDIA